MANYGTLAHEGQTNRFVSDCPDDLVLFLPLRQAIHKSHHALDRTCSDSVVTRRRSYRKSTSDLTEADSEALAVKPQQQPPHQRRRGSSKGGLAYLAARRDRGSRESMKSNASNASVFSNEDLGPLAFQASERGRQRRTSNFLELPGGFNSLR